MSEEPFKLLIMDSIMNNLRVDFSGRGELAERQQKLGQLMQRLRKVGQRGCWLGQVGALLPCMWQATAGPHMGRDQTAQQLPVPRCRRSPRSSTWQCSSPTRQAAGRS